MKKLTSLCKKAALLLMVLMVVTVLLPTAKADAAVKSLSLSKSSATVKAGRTTYFYATVTRSGSTSRKVVVTSTDKTVVTVSSVGSVSSTGKTKITIKGVKKGSAKIKVKTYAKNSSGSYITKYLPVTVNYADVTGLTVSPTSKTLKKGATFTISKTVTPSKANQGVTYSSSNTAVATVSSSGKVTAVKPGSATITVKTKGTTSAGATIKKTVKVTVSYDPVSSLSITPTSKTLSAGSSFTINKTVTPSTANPGVTYESSNTSVATVSTSGKVTAVAPGSAKITVKTKATDTYGSYKYATCTVSVTSASTFSASDYSVKETSTTQYVNFTFDANRVTKEELEAEGYTVEGSTASKTITSPKFTYTFKKLPSTFEDAKKIALNDEYGFGPVAAAIAMIGGQTQEVTRTNYQTSEIYKTIDYLNSSKFSIYNGTAYDHLSKPQVNKTQMCYFDGATPTNGYAASAPYTFTLELGPYYIPARETDINYPTGTPARYMILYTTKGDDSERYCDVWHSSDGNWYLWDDTWTHLFAQVKTPSTGGGW